MAKRVRDIDRGYKALKTRWLRAKNDRHVDVGVVGPGAEDEGEGREPGTTNALIGGVHEFGAPSVGVPERSWNRATVDAKASKYREQIRRLAARVHQGKITQDTALGQLGQIIQGDMVKRINDGIPPPLKDATIAAKTVDGKEGTTPLVDTGEFKGSITYLVRGGK